MPPKSDSKPLSKTAIRRAFTLDPMLVELDRLATRWERSNEIHGCLRRLHTALRHGRYAVAAKVLRVLPLGSTHIPDELRSVIKAAEPLRTSDLTPTQLARALTYRKVVRTLRALEDTLHTMRVANAGLFVENDPHMRRGDALAALHQADGLLDLLAL